MFFRAATAAALLLASQTLAANVITITQYPSVCSAVYTTGTKSFTVVQSTITVQPVPYNDTAYNTAQVPFVIETTPEGSTTWSWLTYDGTTTRNASLAGQYVIRNGGLYTLTGGQISASSGAGVQSFTPSSTVGPISTGFSFTNGVLSWTNAAFPSGSVGFYTNGRDIIFSTNGNVPPGYVKVVIRAVSKSSIDAAPAGVVSVSTSIIVGSMSNPPPPPPGYSSPPYQGPVSSSAPPFVYVPPSSTSSAVSSVGQPPIYASAISSSSAAAIVSSSSAAIVPPPGYSSPPVASASTPPAPVVSPSASASASSSRSSNVVLSPPAASTSSTARTSSSASFDGPPGGYSSPAAASSSPSSTGLVLSTQTYQNTPIGPNNPVISTAVSSSAAVSSSTSTSTATVFSVYTPELPTEGSIYIPTPSFSSPAVPSSSIVVSSSISLPVYSSQAPPIGPNNPTIMSSSSSSSAATSSSSSSSAVSSSSTLPSLPNPYSSPSVSVPVTLPSSSSIAIILPVGTTSSSSSSAAALPPPYSSPTGVSTSSSSSAAPANPPAYSSPSAAVSSSSSSRSSSSSAALSGSSSAQASPAYPVTTTTSSSYSSGTSAAPISSVVPACPAGDGTTFSDANGAVYTFYCNVESNAVSYQTTPARGLQACLTFCDADSKCIAATYAGTAGDGVCYLKSTTGPIVSSPVQYVVKRSGPTNGMGASSSAASSSPSSADTPPVYGQATTTTTTTTMSSSSSSSSAGAALPTSTTTTSTTSTTRTTTTTSTTSTTRTTTTTTTSTSASPYLILPSPTPCDFGDPSGYPEDDSYCELDLPFTVQIYSASSKTTFASTNGYISILAGSSQYQVQQFPDAAIPNNTVAPYFDDLYIYDNSYPRQGIWYQIQGGAVVWEYYLARAGDKGSIYHFTVAYDSAVPGTFRFKYYSVGTDGADKGVNGLYAGVGMQGCKFPSCPVLSSETSGLLTGLRLVTASGSQYKQYSYRQAGSITSGMVITCSTSAGTCTSGGTSLVTISMG